MSYNTALTQWPAIRVPEPVKQHMDKFFSIMDMNAPGAGDRLAEEIFTRNGVMAGPHRAEGTEGMSKPSARYGRSLKLTEW